jgi:tetratricopeptide (TPR) repeat protein
MTTTIVHVMSSGRRRGIAAVAILLVGIAAAALPRPLFDRTSKAADVSVPMAPGVGMPGGPSTSAEGLRGRVNDMETRLREQPHDPAAAILLSDALLRLARATTDNRPAGRAADVLNGALAETPGLYDALRLLGAVNLSLHRFQEALDVGRRARDSRPDDAWNYGVIGDAQLELGDYDEAFASFDTMMQLRPNAAAYARAAYARELTGNLTGALEAMSAALSAAPEQDPEARAWYATQLGELHLKLGDADEADREFRRALFAFPQYPLAVVGTGKAKHARGDRDGALATYVDQLSRTPTLDLAARVGDLHREAGRSAEAERYYQLAEQLAGPAPAQTETNLALFLAEHDRRLPDAVAIAEQVARQRHDIATDHALAWAYFKTGRVRAAAAAMERALRTGSRDEQLRAHATAIRNASKGDAVKRPVMP